MNKEIWVSCSVCHCRMNIALRTTKMACETATGAERIAALKEACWALAPKPVCGYCAFPIDWRDRKKIRMEFERTGVVPQEFADKYGAPLSRFIRFLEFMKRWSEDAKPRQRPGRN